MGLVARTGVFFDALWSFLCDRLPLALGFAMEVSVSHHQRVGTYTGGFFVGTRVERHDCHGVDVIAEEPLGADPVDGSRLCGDHPRHASSRATASGVLWIRQRLSYSILHAGRDFYPRII